MDSLSKVLHRPTASDDKYSRGVVGFVTGSVDFPGAAVLGVSAAMRVGVGMVRYLGPEPVGRLLLEVRPEVVLQNGRVQAWVVGSGVGSDSTTEQAKRINNVLADPGLAVVDAGALDFVDFRQVLADSILTPHAGELVRLLGRYGQVLERADIEADPIFYAELAAKLTGQTVLLKGSISTIADPSGGSRQTPPSNPALATAGSGDVLAGILGALLASNSSEIQAGSMALADIARSGVELHARAADLAAKKGPVVALDIAEAIREVVGEILDEG